jgi:type II secretory ATPase GspE/PulE/Tfp pilus assembly ATPase PilB-like protein
MRTLRMDGARKVIKGQTTVEEVLRVTQMDTF